MTYAQFHLVFLLPAILLAGLAARTALRRQRRRAGWGFLFIVGIAVLYTTPWDVYLVAEGVWWYGEERVVGTLFGVPLEEYAFFVFQPVLMGLALLAAMDFGGPRQPAWRDGAARAGGRTRTAGALVAVGLSVLGFALLAVDRTRYLGLILAWSGPILAFLWGYGGDRLWAVRRRLAGVVLGVTAYLWIADRVALGLEIWTISSEFTIGWRPLGLPAEEALFFAVTNLMVSFGLTLFWMELDPSNRGPRGPLRRLSRGELRRLRDEPHDVLLELAREGGDVVPLAVGPMRAFLLARPAAIRHVLRDHWRRYEKSTFQYRLLSRVTGAGLLTMDGPAWLARRRVAQPSFHRRHVDAMVEEMRAAAQRTAERWEAVADGGGSIDVLHDMSALAIDVLGATVLGAAAGTEDRRDELVQATETVLDHVMARSRSLGLVPDALPTRRNARYTAALEQLDRAVYAAIRDARDGRPAGPLLSMLMAGSDLSDRELRNEAVTFFIAGHETVASALTWTWYLLSQHPDVAHRVRLDASAASYGGIERFGAHLSNDDARDGAPARASGCPVGGHGPETPAAYMRAVLEEALRLYPPAWIATRRAKVDDVICGVTVPRGSLVVASPYATHRLSDVWPDPESFDPGRFVGSDEARVPFSYFPFGGGPHLCIGSYFALIEGVSVLEVLASRFRLELHGDRPLLEAGVTLRPRERLRLRPISLRGRRLPERPAHATAHPA